MHTRRVTGERKNPGPCPAPPSVNAGEAPRPLLGSLLARFTFADVAPQMIQGETRWGSPPNSVGRLVATLVAEIGRWATFRRSESRNPFVENHGGQAQGTASLRINRCTQEVSCHVVRAMWVRNGPRRCPSRHAGVFCQLFPPTTPSTPGGEAPFPGLMINGGSFDGLETLVRPWVLIRSARDSAGCTRLVRLGAFLTSSQTREVVRREERGGGSILELKLWEPSTGGLRAQWGEWLNRLCQLLVLIVGC